MTTEQRIYDGNRAKEVLENEAFIEAFKAIEAEVIEQWTNSPARDADGREKLHQYLMMLRKVKQHLTQTLESGKLAQISVEQEKRRLESIRDGLSLLGKWGT